jgi:hypothetical protein
MLTPVICPDIECDTAYENKNPEHGFSPIYYISQLIIYRLTPSVNKDIH